MLIGKSFHILITEPDLYAPEAIALYSTLGHTELATNDQWTQGNKETNVLVVRLGYPLTEALLQRFPSLQYIITPTTGLNHINTAYCKQKNIKVISLKGERRFLNNIYATAEHTIALILALIRNIPLATEHVKKLGWNRDLFIGQELHGKTLGIIGMGRIGTQVAGMAKAFGLRTIYFDVKPPKRTTQTIAYDNLQQLLEQSDIVSLHVPLEDETIKLINESNILYMKPTAILINTSRGEIVDEEVIADAVQNKRIAGYAADVLSKEYTEENTGSNTLIRLMQQEYPVIITPHIGGATHTSMRKTEIFVAEKFKTRLQKKINRTTKATLNP